MSTMTKVLIVLTTVLSIAVSCLFIAAAAQWNNWKQLAAEYQQQRDSAITLQQSEQAAAQAALALKDAALAERTRALEEAQRSITRLNEEVARERSQRTQAQNEKAAAEAGRTTLQEILDVKTGELKSLQAQHQATVAQNMDLQSRNARLNTRVLDLTTTSTILTDQIRNLQEKLYAAEQRLAAAQAGGPAAPAVAPTVSQAAVAARVPVAGEVRGQVVDVEGSYASVNIGESSGVVVGMTLMVYRDGPDGPAYLGELTIETVRPKEAGGRLSSLAAGEIRSGDKVVYARE